MTLDFGNLVEVQCHVSYRYNKKDLLPRSRFPRQFQATFTMDDGQVHVLDLCYLQSGNNRDAWIIKVESESAKLAVELYVRLLPFSLTSFMTSFFRDHSRPLTRALFLLFRLREYGSGFAFLIGHILPSQGHGMQPGPQRVPDGVPGC